MCICFLINYVLRLIILMIMKRRPIRLKNDLKFELKWTCSKFCKELPWAAFVQKRVLPLKEPPTKSWSIWLKGEAIPVCNKQSAYIRARFFYIRGFSNIDLVEHPRTRKKYALKRIVCHSTEDQVNLGTSIFIIDHASFNGPPSAL